MFAAVSLVTVVLALQFRGHVDTLRDRSLDGQAADVARHLARGPGGAVTVDLPPALAAAYRTEHARYRYAVVDASGTLLAGSPGVEAPLAPRTASRDDRYFSTLDPSTGRRYFGASLETTGALGPFTVQVQQSAEHQDVLADTFLDELADEVLWVVVLVFAAILAVTYWTLHGALAPISEVAARARTIGPGSLDQRLPVEGLPDEVSTLVRAVNDALDRVETGFERERRFTADAAHEMRTPLAVLRAHLDSTGSEVSARLGRDLATLERVVAQLLRLAQVDALEVGPDARADLHAVALDVAMMMGPQAVDADHGLAVLGETGVEVHGSADAVGVALRNLVENAITYSPAGTDVEVEILASPHPAVRVLDRGPGIAEADRGRVFERFWRKGDDGTSGSGLGLSIVERIARAHGARVEIADRPGGGAMITIAFVGEQGSVD